jgi:branched-chain amino acid aminotransferase
VPIQSAEFIWLDGELVPWNDARVHVLAHALNHGTGVFEGLRAYGTADGAAIFRLEDHLSRLERSARSMLMPVLHYDLASAARAVVAAGGFNDCYMRISIFRGYGEMFINPDLSGVSVYVAAWAQDPSFEAADKGLRTTISSWRRPAADVLPPQVKATGAYLTPALARAEAARAGFDDAIMLAPNGNVSEATIANVFAVRDGVLVTPPLSDGALAGITRDTVMKIASDLGRRCEIASLGRHDLYTADELFLTGTGVEIVSIREVDGREIPRGPVARAIAHRYALVVRGHDARSEGWLTLCAADGEGR